MERIQPARWPEIGRPYRSSSFAGQSSRARPRVRSIRGPLRRVGTSTSSGRRVQSINMGITPDSSQRVTEVAGGSSNRSCTRHGWRPSRFEAAPVRGVHAHRPAHPAGARRSRDPLSAIARGIGRPGAGLSLPTGFAEVPDRTETTASQIVARFPAGGPRPTPPGALRSPREHHPVASQGLVGIPRSAAASFGQSKDCAHCSVRAL